jgi:hypothetical protein
VADRAVGGIDFFAARNQLVQLPFLVGIVALGGSLLGFFLHPGLVLVGCSTFTWMGM